MISSVEKCREIALGLHAVHRKLVEDQTITADLLRSQAELLKGLAEGLTEIEKEKTDAH